MHSDTFNSQLCSNEKKKKLAIFLDVSVSSIQSIANEPHSLNPVL